MSAPKENHTSEIKDCAKKYKEIMTKRGLKGLQEELYNNLEAWANTKVNVAVVGNTKTGKSTFISNFLCLDNDASAGTSETSTKIQSYTSKIKNVVFWDLPGVGSTEYPRETFAETMKLEQFDYFILIARSRFTENDTWLSRAIKKIGVKFCFVRTHLDEDISNDKLAKPNTHNRQAVIDSIRNDCSKNLKDVAPADIYLIDSYEREEYDFDKLSEALVQNLTGMKAKLLTYSLATATQDIIDAKAKFLHKRIFSRCIKIIVNYKKEKPDLPEGKILRDESIFFKTVFGISDESLKKDRDLLNLSEIDSDCKIRELEQIGIILIDGSEEFNIICQQFKDILKYVELQMDHLAYIIHIWTILNAILRKYYEFASKIFRSVPFQFAEKCTQ